jgi:hypothetical protein
MLWVSLEHQDQTLDCCAMYVTTVICDVGLEMLDVIWIGELATIIECLKGDEFDNVS